MKIRFVKTHPDAVIPSYAKEGDNGLDLTAVSVEDKNEHYEVKFGIAVEIPEHHIGIIMPRSGITNMNLMMKNGVGNIDSNYRGELVARFKKVKFEDGTQDKLYQVGQRCAQFLILPCPRLEPEEVLFLTDTIRGADGFGSTGH